MALEQKGVNGARRDSIMHADGDENILAPTQSNFEKLYLAPEQAVAGKLRLTFGNPTPIALGGFLLADTPVTIVLMGWGGAGAGTGNAAMGIGSYYFCAMVLLYFGGLGEWILGNTFPAVIFFTFGGFWGSFGATLQPFYAAISSYDSPAGFYDSFAMFLIMVAAICIIYCIAALRTNICLVLVLFTFSITFPCLAASYFLAGAGKLTLSVACRKAGGYMAFFGTVVAWYLWFSLILESVDWPMRIPVGDLSKFIRGASEKAAMV